jgi:hypothetical protein
MPTAPSDFSEGFAGKIIQRLITKDLSKYNNRLLARRASISIENLTT